MLYLPYRNKCKVLLNYQSSYTLYTVYYSLFCQHACSYVSCIYGYMSQLSHSTVHLELDTRHVIDQLVLHQSRVL